jgi:hypothetical protein
MLEKVEDQERDILFAALQKKRGEAQITSLATFLGKPRQGIVSAPNPGDAFFYDLPFTPAVISLTAKNFGKLPESSQELLLGKRWKLLRSSQMLPAVRREAEAGNGQALTRWLELDPVAATHFARKELVRPVPRFSSFSLRLPDNSLPAQERQLASNFVALAKEHDLSEEHARGLENAATLLHRYATRNVLPMVNAELHEWPCPIQFVTLAYLLKVSPEDAAPSLEEAVERGIKNCNRPFTDIGFFQPSPLLEKLAVKHIRKDDDFAVDAAFYIQIYGSARMKPIVWDELKRSKEEKRSEASVWALAEAYLGAQSWTIKPEELGGLRALFGAEGMERLECGFICSRFVTSVSPSAPASYSVDRREYDAAIPEPFDSATHPYFFKNAGEEQLYTIDSQYNCSGLKALKEKLLQFPVGSTFHVTARFSPLDRKEKNEIGRFLRNHGYEVSYLKH